MGKRSVRIAFILEIDQKWMGGVNYFLNLLWLIKNEIKDFETFAFISPSLDENLKKQIQANSDHMICVDFLKTKTPKWVLFKFCNKFFLRNFVAEKILKYYQIDIVSHTCSLFRDIKSIAWIPDFQHKHLPQMFSKREIDNRNKTFLALIKNTQATIVSSLDAFKDCCDFAPQYSSKIYIFHFISQIKKDIGLDSNLLKEKGIKSPFFFVPNQLWKHKNHTLLIEAAKILLDKNIGFQIICSGNMNDYRHKDYKHHILNLIKKYNLEQNILFLGLISYEQVIMLMKHSIAVINPSLFEGWSSIVEECKSLEKPMVLSDIDVHLEQYPQAYFFQKNSAISLAEVLTNMIKQTPNKTMVDYNSCIKQAKNEYFQIIINQIM